MKVFVLSVATGFLIALSGYVPSPAGNPDHANVDVTAESRAHEPGFSALHAAIEAGELDRVADLLNTGTSPNSATHSGWTPLMEAARRGQPDIVRELLAAGADPESQDLHGRTALDAAVEGGNEEVVMTLVQATRGDGSPTTFDSPAPQRGVVRAVVRSPR